MTVQELIDALSQMNPNAEVRIAHQLSWPFELSIKSVVSAEVEDDMSGMMVDNVWIGEGSRIGYLPKAVESALGW